MASSDTLSVLAASAPTLSVGILTADLLALGSELKVLEKAGVVVAHVDVMDGCFVPMMTVGPPIVRAMKTPLLRDVHLMIDEPLEKVDAYVAAGADLVTVHVESSDDIRGVLERLGTMTNANDASRGLVRGVALNPETPVEAIAPLLDQAELVLLLAVTPGLRGQRFNPTTFDRLGRVKEIVARAARRILVGVDGGITRQNVAEVARAGADLIVTGSAVFDGRAAAANARAMLQAVQTG